MTIRETPIAGVLAVDATVVRDHRGLFARCFCEEELAPILNGRRVCQVNVSRTVAVGAIRGLHFQRSPHAEMKLIRCLRGRVWDVAVDLRANSPTFLQWHAEELSPTNMRMIVIPEGCAHGFQVQDAESELLYIHTAMYHRDSEGAVRFDDPRVSIPWPLTATDLSERDLSHALLRPDFTGIELSSAISRI